MGLEIVKGVLLFEVSVVFELVIVNFFIKEKNIWVIFKSIIIKI